MAEAATQLTPRATPILQTMISGRVDNVRVYDGKCYTTVTCPAKDTFSMPSVIEVQSSKRFAEVGQDLTPRLCNVSGYIKPFKYTDQDTGERKEGRKANVYFELIE